MKSAKEIIETFWKIQDEGDYTKVVNLFSNDAILLLEKLMAVEMLLGHSGQLRHRMVILRAVDYTVLKMAC
jgi:hypothetical protein